MAIPTSYFRSETSQRLRAEGRAVGLVEGRVEGRTEGRAEGRAEDILLAFEVRGIAVSDAVRERITGCADPEILREWLARAITAERSEDVFGGDET
jgi:hypothetical protein